MYAIADEGPAGLVGGDDRLLGLVGVGIEVAAGPGADELGGIDRGGRLRHGHRWPVRQVAVGGAARHGKAEERDTGPAARTHADQAASSRPRPWGAMKSIAGPFGTIPVGLMVRWLA